MSKFKIVFFDCDGVLLFGNPWKRLAKAVNLPSELDQQWFEDYYSGKITFDQWNKNVEDFYKKAGLSRKLFEEVMNFKNYLINKEAEEIIDYLKNDGYEIAIISSGTGYYVSKVADYFGIKYWHANNELIFNEKGDFMKLKYVDEDPNAKLIGINEVCRLLKVKPTETVFVGDESNDQRAFEYTEHGILYKSNNPKLERLAWKKINNLNELKGILENPAVNWSRS